MILYIIFLAGAQFVMLVCMHILVEQVAGEMTWNPLLTHLSSFFVVGYLGKDIRLSFFKFAYQFLFFFKFNYFNVNTKRKA